MYINVIMKYNTLNSIFNYLSISTLFIVPNQFPLSILHPLNLYTIDINYNITPQKGNNICIVSNKEKRKLLAQKKQNLQMMIEEYGSVTSIILEKQSYKELIKVRSSEFNENWTQAMENYKKGNWIVAKAFFETCLQIEKEDGPATTLLSTIITTYLQEIGKGFES